MSQQNIEKCKFGVFCKRETCGFDHSQTQLEINESYKKKCSGICVFGDECYNVYCEKKHSETKQKKVDRKYQK